MAYNPKLKEEEIKNKVAADLFPMFDCTCILGNIDFCVSPKDDGPTLWETESLLWAEAKTGLHKDFAPLFTQLVLTIGGERTYDTYSPPPFLGAFDSERIAFIPWHTVLDLFFRSDIDWTVAPSNTDSTAFRHVLGIVRPVLDANLISFQFGDTDLEKFIRRNLFVGNNRANSLNVTRNNFPFVYQKWIRAVKPSIAVNWNIARRQGIHDADFFLADLLSKDNATLMQKLFVVLRGNHYLADRQLDPSGILTEKRVDFNDGQKAHAQFWNQYRRPPRREFWDFINERRDLLMPPDIRERQGSFFTPQIWVEKAQETIAEVLGENWQDDHYVWDCAAGTGNLLAGLDPNAKYRVWASTLQQGDVDIMRERIRNGAALLDSHVFQFDFLNDDFGKLPESLRTTISDPEKRRQLVIFINPPYAEAGNIRATMGTGENKPEVATGTAANAKFKPLISAAANEMFALFLIRVAREIPGCVLAQFSKLKHIQAPNFKLFRQAFSSRLERAFVVPAKTFDNVKGEFPIGFFVWRTGGTTSHFDANAKVFNAHGNNTVTKFLTPPPHGRLWMDWLKTMHDKAGERIGYFRTTASDFQNQIGTFITNAPSANDFRQVRIHEITHKNVLGICNAFAVRLCVAPTWLNDRDQFLWPADTWLVDREFQLDCLAYTLFHGQNRISCRNAGILPANIPVTPQAGSPRSQSPINHWIPFSENLVGAKDAYASHFMIDFLKNPKLCGHSTAVEGELFPGTADEDGCAMATAECAGNGKDATGGMAVFSSEAQSVFLASLELWRYYHAQPDAIVDASFYDIRAHFQGFKPNGTMNQASGDGKYTDLISNLRSAQKTLAAKIAVKVHEHGFLN